MISVVQVRIEVKIGLGLPGLGGLLAQGGAGMEKVCGVHAPVLPTASHAECAGQRSRDQRCLFVLRGVASPTMLSFPSNSDRLSLFLVSPPYFFCTKLLFFRTYYFKWRIWAQHIYNTFRARKLAHFRVPVSGGIQKYPITLSWVSVYTVKCQCERPSPLRLLFF